MLDKPIAWVLAAVGLALLIALILGRRDLVRAARGKGRSQRLVRSGLAVLAWLGLGSLADGCRSEPRPSCYAPMEVPAREGPSEDYRAYERLHQQAEALRKQVEADQVPAEAARKSLAALEQQLVELEPRVSSLDRQERPHARRLVDQSLALCEAIRERLAERGAGE